MRSRDTRPISWIKAARKAFDGFPKGAQDEILRVLTVAAEGRKADIAKPLKGLGSGVFEVASSTVPMRIGRFTLCNSRSGFGFYTPSKRRQGRASRPQSRISI